VSHLVKAFRRQESLTTAVIGDEGVYQLQNMLQPNPIWNILARLGSRGRRAVLAENRRTLAMNWVALKWQRSINGVYKRGRALVARGYPMLPAWQMALLEVYGPLGFAIDFDPWPEDMLGRL